MRRIAIVVVAAALIFEFPAFLQAGECTTTGDLSGLEEWSHAEIQRFDQDVGNLTLRVRSMMALGQPVPGKVAIDTAELDSELERIAIALEQGGAGPDNRMLRKVDQLRTLLGNVTLAVSGETDAMLPRVTASEIDSSFQSTAMRQVPENDDCGSALPIFYGTVAGTTSEATNDGTATCGASMSSPDVWFRFAATESRWVHINTIGSDFDTVLSVHSDCTGAISNQLTCNDDSVGLQSGTAFEATAGSEYLIRVAGSAGATGNYVLEVGDGGTVQGTVRRSNGATPIAEIDVRVYSEDGYVLRTGETDGSGQYTVDNLQTGTVFSVTRYASPYFDELYDDIACPGGPGTGCDPLTGTPIPVSLGSVSGGIDFSLDQSGTILGLVTDEGTGDDIVGARITFYNDVGSYVGYSTTCCGTGYFTKTNLQPGTYFAIAEKQGEYAKELFDGMPCHNGCDPTSGMPIVVNLNDPATGINFTLSSLGKIEGTVVESNSGNPAVGVGVRAVDSGGVTISSTGTDSAGLFEIGGLPDGEYYVMAYDYDYVDQLFPGINCEDWSCSLGTGELVSASVGTITGGIDFALDVEGVVRGRVTDEATGQPLSSIRAELWNEAGERVSYDYASSDGQYEISHIEPGTYFVATNSTNGFFNELYDDIPCPGGPPDDCNVITGTPVAVAMNVPTEGIDFALDRRPSIEGVVSGEMSGLPVEGVTVYAYTAERWYDSDVTDGNGVFELVGLAPGDFFVVTKNADDVGFVDELYDDIPCPGGTGHGCNHVLGTPIEVPGVGSVTGIDFALTTMATISGQVVTRESGTPLSGVPIRIRNTEATIVGSSSTDASGDFTVGGLPAGTYYASTTDSGGYVGQLYDDILCPGGVPQGCLLLNGAPIDLDQASQAVGIDFALDRAGEIAGSVVAEDSGAPIASAYVRAWDDAGQIVASDNADSAGEYLLQGLAAGDYKISSTKSGYHGELFFEIPCLGGSPDYCDFGDGTPVAVELGATTTGIDFTLGHRGSIEGIVTDGETGLLVDGARIGFYDASGSNVTTMSLGGSSYSIDLGQGTYFVAVTSCSGYFAQLFEEIPIDPDGFNPTIGEPVVVTEGSVTRHIDFPLVKAGAITGRVSDVNTDEVVGNSSVVVYALNGSLVAWDSAIYQEGYRIEGLVAGDYFVGTRTLYDRYIDQLYDSIPCPGGVGIGCDPTSGTVVTVLPGATERIDFALLPTGTVTGRVTSDFDGQPLDSVAVEVWDQLGQEIGSGWTNATGAYSIDGLESGAYFVVTAADGSHIDQLHDGISCPGGPGVGCNPTLGTPVSVAAGAPAVVDFVLQQWGVVAGQVSESGGGEPTSSVTVRAYTVPGDILVASASTNSSDWRYRIEGLPTGEYVIHALSYGYVDETYNDIPCEDLGCDLSSGERVAAAINIETNGIDFVLAPLEGSVSGTVVDESTGSPLYQVSVEIYDSNGTRRDIDYSNSNGSYYLTRLAPGEYYVVAEPNSGLSYLAELYDDIPCYQGPPVGCDPTKGTPITVSDELVTGIDFALGPFMVTGAGGVITDAATGDPVVGAYVDLWRESNGQHYETVITANDGSFFAELYAGTYYLSTDTDHRYDEEVYDDILCPGGPAFQGFCDPYDGTPVVVVSGEITDGLDFVLGHGAPVFADRFESGDTTNWSVSIP